MFFLVGILFPMCCLAQEMDAEKEQVAEAFSYYNNNNMKKTYAMAHRLLKTVKINKSKSNVNLLLAYYFNAHSLVDSSMYYIDKALLYKVESDSLRHRRLSLAYNLRALNYKNKGLFFLSKKWHLLGVEVSKKYNEKDLYYGHIYGLANSYLLLGQDKKALEYFLKSKENSQDKEIILGVYINIASIYSSQKKFKLSNSCLLKAEKIARKNRNDKALATVFLNMGNNYNEVADFDKALDFYIKAKELCVKHKDQNLELILTQNIIDIFIIKNKLKEASILLGENISKAINLGLLQIQVESYKKLALIFKQKKDFKSAFETVNRYHKLKDSISNLQKSKEVISLEVKFRTLEKDQAIKVLQIQNLNKKLKLKTKDDAIEKLHLEQKLIEKESENSILSLENKVTKRKSEISLLKKKGQLKVIEMKRQKSIQYFILIAFLILLAPIIGVLVMYYQKLQAQSLLHEKEKEVASQNVVTLMKDQELKLIKAEVEGQDRARQKIAQEMHDSVGGNLAAIKLQFSQLDKHPEKKDLIYKQLDETYEQVRDLSHDLIPKTILNSDFVPLIKSYLDNIAVASSLQINISVYPENEVNKLEKEIQNELFSVLKELITNSLKYAEASVIDVQLDVVDGNLFFMFEDNGKGFDVGRITKGIGLENIKNRIENIRGSFAIDAHPNRGTIINIEIERV